MKRLMVLVVLLSPGLASAMNGCADLPVLDTLRESLAAAVRAGHSDEDFCAMIRMLQPD